ncbi:hypothetical protein HZS_4724, partial [Henneguya salminicola]
LKNCDKYTAIVKIPGSKIWRIVQFTYKSQTKSPKNIEYDYSRFLLNWSYYTEYCFSSWFYIECLNRDKIVLQHFSTNNYLVVPYNSKLACHVSTCPLNVFNISCSGFSTTIYLELKIAFIILIPLIIIFCILYFLQRKRKMLFSNLILNYFSSCSLNPFRTKMKMKITYVVTERYDGINYQQMY